MSLNGSLEYLMYVCDSIKQRQIELNYLCHTYFYQSIDRQFLNKEKEFYDQIAVTFLAKLEDGLVEEDRKNLICLDHLLKKAFSHSTCAESKNKLTVNEEKALKISLSVFTPKFHSKFIRTLQCYNIKASFPPDSKEEEIRFFCELRLKLLRDVLSSPTKYITIPDSMTLLAIKAPTSELCHNLKRLSEDKDRPIRSLMKETDEVLLSKERLPDTLNLVNSIFQSIN
jgi:hypothetical protein